MHCRKTAHAHQAQIAMAAVVVATNSVAHAQDPARAAVADTVKYVFLRNHPCVIKDKINDELIAFLLIRTMEARFIERISIDCHRRPS